MGRPWKHLNFSSSFPVLVSLTGNPNYSLYPRAPPPVRSPRRHIVSTQARREWEDQSLPAHPMEGGGED